MFNSIVQLMTQSQLDAYNDMRIANYSEKVRVNLLQLKKKNEDYEALNVKNNARWENELNEVRRNNRNLDPAKLTLLVRDTERRISHEKSQFHANKQADLSELIRFGEESKRIDDRIKARENQKIAEWMQNIAIYVHPSQMATALEKAQKTIRREATIEFIPLFEEPKLCCMSIIDRAERGPVNENICNSCLSFVRIVVTILGSNKKDMQSYLYLKWELTASRLIEFTLSSGHTIPIVLAPISRVIRPDVESIPM